MTTTAPNTTPDFSSNYTSRHTPGWWWKALLGMIAYYIILPYRLTNFIHRVRGVRIHNWTNTVIAYHVTLDLIYPEMIEIEEGAWLTQNVTVLAHFRPTDIQAPYIGGDRVRQVRIGRGAYLGNGAMVMPGVTIGECAVIGAGSVVTRDVPSFMLAAGNPARAIKRIEDIQPVELVGKEA